MSTPTVEKLRHIYLSGEIDYRAISDAADLLQSQAVLISELEAENAANMDTCKGIIQGLKSELDKWKESTIASNASFNKAEQVAYDLEVERDKLLANLDVSTAIEMQENSKPYQKRTEAILNWYMDYLEKDNKIVENIESEMKSKSDLILQAQLAFDAYASQYDTFSDAWQDMGAHDYFRAGYIAHAMRK